jgi:hypothetical protein
MSPSPDIAAFIRDQFRSVWTLEVLLFLKSNPDEAFGSAELVRRLRASDAIVSGCLNLLQAGGLIVMDEGGAALYAPASTELGALADQTQKLYAAKPDAVRRLIVMAANSGLAAFSDSFQLWRK